MDNYIDLDRKEINILNLLDDPKGHAWLFYLVLKNSIIYETNLISIAKTGSIKLLWPKVKPEEFNNMDYIQNILDYLMHAGLIRKFASTEQKVYWQLLYVSTKSINQEEPIKI
tara:strand:+ start:7030 stop:7368 length:339 start_codon:yes stop_codon:yes gene_type:complete